MDAHVEGELSAHDLRQDLAERKIFPMWTAARPVCAVPYLSAANGK